MAIATSNYTYSGTATPVSKAAPERTDPCADTKPVCPACGGLKCLCRPRFFPGQLLTEDDLNRLLGYVIDKNKLHNRYLHGWGVACGLEVVCDPCDASRVVVRSGYALSPCGDDIVVSKDQSVPVCELINLCQEPTEPVCDPPYQQAARECRDDRTEQWVLAICYDENPSRGITALSGAADTGCYCGGSGNCGCGGNGSCSSAAASSASTNNKTARPQCEPTQVCEGYRFVAYKAPKPDTGVLGDIKDSGKVKSSLTGMTRNLLFASLYANRARLGPLLERVMCCVLRAMELRAAIVEGRNINSIEAVGVYNDYAQALMEFAQDFAIHRCAFVSKVRVSYDDARRLVLEAKTDQWTSAQLIGRINEGIVSLDYTWLDIVTECFCSALLPPCPEPPSRNCVPLAVVTVQTGASCRVVEICNWRERKLLINVQTIMYWLSWLPWQCLREWVAKLCCKPNLQSQYFVLALIIVATFAKLRPCGVDDQYNKMQPGAVPPPQMRMMDSAEVSMEKLSGFEAAMRSDDLMAHLLGEFEQLRAGTSETAPMWASLAARMLDGSAVAPLAGAQAVAHADLETLSSQLGVAELRTQIAEMQTTINRQSEILNALRIVNDLGKT